MTEYPVIGLILSMIATAYYSAHFLRRYLDAKQTALMAALARIESHMAAQRDSLHIIQQDTRELRKVDEEVRAQAIIQIMAAKLGVPQE